MRSRRLVSLVLAAGLVLLAGPVDAQQQSEKWTFRLTPYLVGTAMNGNLTIHGRTAAVDVSFDNILENLEFGAMLHLMATKGPWSISLDGIYMGLGAASDKPPAQVEMDQWLVELAGAYRLTPWLDALAGARYNSLSSDIVFQGPQGREGSGDLYWIDPIVGARLAARLGEEWTLRGRADIGGFGITSNLTWQLAAYVDFRASDLIAIVGGYRFLGNDYETGSGNELFHYDLTVSGPALGLSFIL